MFGKNSTRTFCKPHRYAPDFFSLDNNQIEQGFNNSDALQQAAVEKAEESKNIDEERLRIKKLEEEFSKLSEIMKTTSQIQNPPPLPINQTPTAGADNIKYLGNVSGTGIIPNPNQTKLKTKKYAQKKPVPDYANIKYFTELKNA